MEIAIAVFIALWLSGSVLLALLRLRKEADQIHSEAAGRTRLKDAARTRLKDTDREDGEVSGQ